jgi:hypothetical protein
MIKTFLGMSFLSQAPDLRSGRFYPGSTTCSGHSSAKELDSPQPVARRVPSGEKAIDVHQQHRAR